MIAIGAGRIGTALEARAAAAGLPFTLIHRERGWDALDGPVGHPILLCVRTDDLPIVAARVPERRVQDLVILQNGMLRTPIFRWGLGGCTRAELYLAVAQRGGPIVAGQPSIFCGPHASEVAGWLDALGLPVRVVDWMTFSYYELEKTIWLSAYGALCERHAKPVGRIGTEHADELRALVAELLRVGRVVYGIDAPLDFTLDRLTTYSAAIADWPAAVREWPYRNGWFREMAAKYNLQTPIHDALTAGRP